MVAVAEVVVAAVVKVAVIMMMVKKEVTMVMDIFVCMP